LLLLTLFVGKVRGFLMLMFSLLELQHPAVVVFEDFGLLYFEVTKLCHPLVIEIIIVRDPRQKDLHLVLLQDRQERL